MKLPEYYPPSEERQRQGRMIRTVIRPLAFALLGFWVLYAAVVIAMNFGIDFSLPG